MLLIAEIIGDHDIAGDQRRCEQSFDPGQQRCPIDGAVEHHRGKQATIPQVAQERRGLPMPVWSVAGVGLPLGLRTPSPQINDLELPPD